MEETLEGGKKINKEYALAIYKISLVVFWVVSLTAKEA